MQRKDDSLGSPLDDAPTQPGTLQTSRQIPANLFILDELLRKIFFGIPVGVPTADNAQTKTGWMRFLTQCLFPYVIGKSFLYSSLQTI
jgi:hypothetical protein